MNFVIRSTMRSRRIFSDQWRAMFVGKDPANLYAYWFINEALATGLGNGWAYARGDGTSE